MLGKPVRASSLVPAIALAVLTLAVFWVLQDYGPESAIRRFHDAVLSRDALALAQVTEDDLNDLPTQRLIQNVLLLGEKGATYRILGMQRETRRVAAEVQYNLPDGKSGRTIWIVVKRNRVWKVEASETGQYFRKTLGL